MKRTIVASLLLCLALAVPVAYSVVITDIRVNGDVLSTANPMPVTGTLSPGGTSDVNVKQINGTTAASGSGVVGAGTQRVVLATDQPALTAPLLVTPGGNVADAAADSGNPLKVGGIYESTPPTYTTGQRGNAHVTSRGELKSLMVGAPVAAGDGTSNTINFPAKSGTDITGAPLATAPFVFNGTTWDRQPGNTTGTFAVGNVASGASDSGNPLKVGGVYNSTPPTLTNAQRGDLQVGTRGSLSVTLFNQNGVSAFTGASPSADAVTSASVIGLAGQAFTYSYNGTNWDRQFTCPSSAVINVTAAATTEIVALTASQVIRVCSFVITESLGGTAAFVYGTGTNCATGQTAITGAMALSTGGNISLSAGKDSLFRTASANALCLTAVTGNIVGFLTYAKF